ncbi:MAG: NADH-quinone oxidoreductase subunit NuoB, partial [Anaerolineae bacterium]
MTPPLEQRLQNPIPSDDWRNLFAEPINLVYNWGRMYSLWPLAFGLACCAIEMMATFAARFDLGRFGAELMRPSPRQADLLIVSGTVTKKMVPQIVRLYNQMPEPKYVIAMGACATAGGPFKEGYNVVSGIDKFLPVDVYIPGCPPTPQALLEGFLRLQDKIKRQSIFEVPWYRKQERNEAIPIPLYGPDLIDPRRISVIKEELARQRAVHSQETPSGEQGSTAPSDKALKLPVWDITPLSPTAALAERLNQAVGDGCVIPEKDVLVVQPAHLVEVATYLRDTPDLDYDLLSNLTGVDYLGRDPRFEVVYHVYSTSRGGGPLVLKARVPEENPELPSLVSVWPSANLQEREVWDLFGIRFTGHPNLKRILLWEGFYGHPLRKNWREPYYEEPVKPFSSRWPAGHYQPAEARTPYDDNVSYPLQYPPEVDWDPELWSPPEEELPIVDYRELPSLHISTEKIVVNVGPQHPSTHGVFRMVLTLDGETVLHVAPVGGYLPRNHENSGARNSWLMHLPYT